MPASATETPLAERLDAVDWVGVAASLRERPYARLGTLLSRGECDAVARGWGDENLFRSRVDMERHRFGIGAYKYYRYPLPRAVEDLRNATYPHLAPIANRWMEELGVRERYPETLGSLLARCHGAGQARPTPLLLRYEAGGYNALHQDLYGPVAFPLQIAILLNQPGLDYDGGAFLLVEQRPRAQSIGEALVPNQGEAVVFTTRYRPVPSVRGFSRANVRHGVSRLERGLRHTLGIIFHDAL